MEYVISSVLLHTFHVKLFEIV